MLYIHCVNNTLGNIQKANRTNSTFGFCRHAKPTLKKPKELFFEKKKKNVSCERKTTRIK